MQIALSFFQIIQYIIMKQFSWKYFYTENEKLETKYFEYPISNNKSIKTAIMDKIICGFRFLFLTKWEL